MKVYGESQEDEDKGLLNSIFSLKEDESKPKDSQPINENALKLIG